MQFTLVTICYIVLCLLEIVWDAHCVLSQINIYISTEQSLPSQHLLGLSGYKHKQTLLCYKVWKSGVHFVLCCKRKIIFSILTMHCTFCRINEALVHEIPVVIKQQEDTAWPFMCILYFEGCCKCLEWCTVTLHHPLQSLDTLDTAGLCWYAILHRVQVQVQDQTIQIIFSSVRFFN